jgi:long-chain fatty acid transport protein
MVLGILLLSPAISSAGNPVEGSRAAAMGAAFVAVADDPSTIAHNPAGLANLRGTNLYGGVTASELTSEYRSPSGDTEDTLHQYFFPPHLYFTSNFNRENITFGVGIYSPFGIGGRKWSEQGLTRYAATENLIATLCVNPVLAFKAGPYFSFGFGIIYLGEKSISEKMVNQTALGAEDGKTSLKGQGGGWGYNLGFILFPGDTLSFGVAYRSAVRIEETSTFTFENVAPALRSYFGGSKFETDADAVLHFPPVLNLGLAWRPTKSLTLSFDAEWIGWSSFDKVDLHLRKEVPQGGLTSSSIPLNWHDVWVFKVGTEYQVIENFALRAGYVYSQNPVPEDTLNPGNPDSDQQYISCGFGYKRKGITLDVFYMAEIFKDRAVQNSILNGEYKSFAQGLGLSFGYKF